MKSDRSSVYIRLCTCSVLGIPAIIVENSNGDNIEPYGTPLSAGLSPEYELLILTLNLIPLKKSASYLSALPLNSIL